MPLTHMLRSIKGRVMRPQAPLLRQQRDQLRDAHAHSHYSFSLNVDDWCVGMQDGCEVVFELRVCIGTWDSSNCLQAQSNKALWVQTIVKEWACDSWQSQTGRVRVMVSCCP